MADSVWIEAKKRSEVWKHFWIKKDAGNQVKCKSCPTILEFSSSTTNMWRHLEKIHHLDTSGKHPPGSAYKDLPAQFSGAGASILPNEQSDGIVPSQSNASTKGPQLLQISIEKSFAGFRLEPLSKVLARLAAKDRLSYRVIAESEDIREEFSFNYFKLFI